MEPNEKDRCDLSGVVPALAGTFKALGDPTRLNLVCLLATDTTGTLGVSDLAALTNVSQPAVSQHLKTLKSEGLVESRRDGLYIYYTINRERMVGFREQYELMYAGIMEKCNRELL
ncbi:MAG: metalloregulator ArsR/SmtB family transcription factor, partial [Methanoregulaceae archaeon]|nr:metalloregulator ArsR/SmtB family transcription factor [Methanoregulaceae archaeon]